METATSYGGPFVVLPRSLIAAWVEGIGDRPTPDSGLYGKACGTPGLMHVVPFQGTDVLRIGEDPGDLFWVELPNGGIVIQWIAADSLDELIQFGREVVDRNKWLEELVVEIPEDGIQILDSCGFEGDDQPKIQASVSAGTFQVQATFEEGERTWATVFKFSIIKDYEE